MTDTKRELSNPLALAVLACLFERPMHPYEMATTMRERGKEQSIKLNYGSLYTVIEQLVRAKFIAVREVLKEGKRPEKTVYDITPAGAAELIAWMRELVSSPVKEYPVFEAALSLLPVLPPEEVIELLQIRLGLLQKTLDEIAQQERLCREMNLPRLFSLEGEYFKAVTLAEQEFTKRLLADLQQDAGGMCSGWSQMRNQLLAAKERAAGATERPEEIARRFTKKPSDPKSRKSKKGE